MSTLSPSSLVFGLLILQRRLCHIVIAPHDHLFHNLWNELREEHQSLLIKGYTGEGFLSHGHKLGGKRVPLDEMRRQARRAAEERHNSHGTSSRGHRLGGVTATPGIDMRKVIADAATRRTSITDGCASGRKEAGKLSHDAAQSTFRTKADEDDANDRAIAQALQELMEEEELLRLEQLCAPSGGDGLAWDPVNGLHFDGNPRDPVPAAPDNVAPPTASVASSARKNSSGRPISRLVPENAAKVKSRSKTKAAPRPPRRPVAKEEEEASEDTIGQSAPSTTPCDRTWPGAVIATSADPHKWACPQCTLLNPLDFLSCDVCGLEQPPQPIPASARYGSGSTAAAPALPKPPPAASMRGPGTTPFELANGRRGWNCLHCGRFMEEQWWMCSLCGVMKDSS